LAADIFSKLQEIGRNATRVVRVEESREFAIQGESARIKEASLEVSELDTSVCRETPVNSTVGVDSSSRVVDTPYMFIAVAAATGVSRIGLRAYDIPSPSSLLSHTNNKYILVIPEVEPFNHQVLDELGVEYKDPSSRPYTPGYNKALALEEHRVNLENMILGEVSKWGEIVLLDGPLFLPSHPVTEARGSSKLIDVYKENWEVLMRRRLSIVEKINLSSRVYGVVKRLQYTHILSRDDPFNLGVTNVSDQAYLSILTERIFHGKPSKPIIIGPIHVSSGFNATTVERTMWYLSIPRRLTGGGLGSFTFYRVEEIGYKNSLEDLQPVIFDSICSGTSLPVSILLADHRVKKLSEAITRQIVLAVGATRESTLQYLTL